MENIFTQYAIIKTIKNNIDDYEGVDEHTFEDAFKDMFGGGLVLDSQEAKNELQKYGIWNALKDVKAEGLIIEADPEDLARQLLYVNAEPIFETCFTNAPAFIGFDSCLSVENVKAFKEALNEL
ncbi:hypothetical protein [Lactobacillus hominis]|uniref:Uncharacterized protein n=1 Tax=Lactobacillus hominis DSM 23910 = CRBIP 24.179 TaxID=1423758 RepID=I7JUR0_9LACO|nr:hypothetical protein [Lactobacillus hominis]KRM85840.1 hypothetical protein FC41_GL000026 [Lactobacillus hominis DSM 23910 = CRBIP 24.179]MCT3348924.1 hypothetical protein [Lactobacillus hominis]CCI81616.1 Protein of unknown function [Lactobacillus hominis DSM 23910 = CRBIP 24.179]